MKTLYGALFALVLLVPVPAPAADPAAPPAPALPAAIAGSPKKLDVNRATLPEFVGVPGIGSVMAQQIVDLRLAKGKFTKIEELLEIKGIGPKKLAALGAYLAIAPTPAPGPTTPGTPQK